MLDTIGTWLSGDTAPEWFAAIGTVGALIVAVRLLGREARRDEHREEDRSSPLGGPGVAGWVEWVEALPPSTRALAGPGDGCILLNTSPVPVYDLLLVFHMLGEAGAKKAGRGQGAPVATRSGDSRRTREDINRRWRAEQGTYPALRVEVRFTDATGRRWWRAHDGVLTDGGPYRPDDPEEVEDGAAHSDD